MQVKFNRNKQLRMTGFANNRRRMLSCVAILDKLKMTVNYDMSGVIGDEIIHAMLNEGVTDNYYVEDAPRAKMKSKPIVTSVETLDDGKVLYVLESPSDTLKFVGWEDGEEFLISNQRGDVILRTNISLAKSIYSDKGAEHASI